MKQQLFRIAYDERGVQITEWVALGALFLTLVTAFTGVLTGNKALRSALSNTLGRYAVFFGQDVVARGPSIPRGPGQVDPFNNSAGVGLLVLEPSALTPEDARLVVNIRAGSYTTLNPAGQIVATVRPADGIVATVEPSSGMIRLSDPLGQRPAALLNPRDGRATLFNPATRTNHVVGLEELQRIGLVVVERGRQIAEHWLSIPVLGIPQLLDGR